MDGVIATLLHRLSMIVWTPLLFAIAVGLYIIAAPFCAYAAVRDGYRRHWS